MNRTDYLMPGYVTQGGCLARGGMFLATAQLAEKNELLGCLASAPVTLLCTASKYVELPLQLIEDVAFTAINLVGAIFNQECRNNLKYCFYRIGEDSFSAMVSTIILLSAPLMISVAVYHGTLKLVQLCNAKSTTAYLNKNSNLEFAESWRLQAFRKQGFNRIRLLESFNSNFKAKMDLSIYKTFAEFKFSGQEFRDVLAVLLPQNVAPPNNTAPPWDCPAELAADRSALSVKIQHICKISHEVDFGTLSPPQKKEALCKILGISGKSSTAAMRVAVVTNLIVLHPDRVEEPLKKHAEKACQEISDACEATKEYLI